MSTPPPSSSAPTRPPGWSWCLELVARLGLERPAVVGCSIGGKIALDVAARAPERLAGVVAMAADACTGGRPSPRGLRRELSDVAAPSRADRTHLGMLAVLGRHVPPGRAELIATTHRREDPTVSTSDLLGWTAHDLREPLARITCPAHPVVGADDLWLDVERVRWAAGRIPCGRVTVLDGVGHYPMEEIEGFDAVLDGWLRELAPVREAS